jgi:hypothetical protein
MTRYVCAKCNEVFTHTAKQIYTETPQTYLDFREDNKTSCTNPAKQVTLTTTVETSVCPFCHNIKFTEFIEPIEELEDVISVEYVNVGAKIAEGYKVKEIYAKSCTLVKPKKKVEA